MTLSEMRTLLSSNLHDDNQSLLTAARANSFLNQAMHHVAALLASLDAGFLVRTQSINLTNPSLERLYIKTATDLNLVLGVRRLLMAERTDATGDDPTLEVIDFSAAIQTPTYTGQGTRKPKVFAFNHSFGFLNAPVTLPLKVTYTVMLPDMVADSDTPGQASGAGDANVLHSSFHYLIPTYAAALVYAAEGVIDAAMQWKGVFDAERDAALASFGTRRSTPDRG